MTDQTLGDPDAWKTGDEPMTDAQRSYLRTLSGEAGEPFDEKLTKAEASERIDQLQARSPRLARGVGEGGRLGVGRMTTHKAPDSPGPDSVDDELNKPTHDSMDRLGRAGLAEEPDGEAPETTDRTTPGQNSDWLPQ